MKSRLVLLTAVLVALPVAAIADDGSARALVPYAGTPLEGNPYSLEWLYENHGRYDNKWTAQYEAWLQGDDETARAIGRSASAAAPVDARPSTPIGKDGDGALGVDVRMSNAGFNTSQNEFQIVINPENALVALGSSNDGQSAGVGLYRTTDGRHVDGPGCAHRHGRLL